MLHVRIWVGAALALLSAAGAAASAASAPADARVSVLTSKQVVEILDDTVNWYRTLATQEQAATQPSDLLILYANRQTANQVVGLAFDIARANAELLSSEENAEAANAPASSADKLAQENTEVDAQVENLQKDLKRDGTQQLAMLKAKKNLLDTMSDYVNQTDAKGADANDLKAQIDAIAATVPQLGVPATAPLTAPAGATAVTPPGAASHPLAGKTGIWDLSLAAFGLRRKLKTIDLIAAGSAKLAHLFEVDSAPSEAQLKAYTARSDALVQQAQSADAETQKTLRGQFDTLAWLFKQTSGVLLPLDKAQVLLRQYQRNLASWRSATEAEYHEALGALGIRVAILLAMLFAVWMLAEVWKRAVLKFVRETRRRYQLLLVQRIVMWVAMVAIVGLNFTTEISSFATFAGLLTAGLAVAMQSVLVSVVGYFFLIGKYGIRVGDRIQIGAVVGEVIDIGLVRMHLMELNTTGPLGPTGRVVAFANLIVFQASGGLFKQIPGVTLSWHESTLEIPGVSDYAALKERLRAAVAAVLAKYQDELLRQAREIERSTATSGGGDSEPQVQMHLSDGRMVALIRYPVHGEHAAQIDEEVAEAVLGVIAKTPREPPQLPPAVKA
jgi:small-conductance mechanosensitive channel